MRHHCRYQRWGRRSFLLQKAKVERAFMLRRSLLGLFCTLTIASAASGQIAYTPEKGSPERKAIMDALRIPVERELKQKIVFVADDFRVQGTWAFVGGRPQNPAGGEPNYR